MKKEENIRIDVHNDVVMRENGLIRPYEQSPRDPSVWSKTSAERKALKKATKHEHRKNMHFGTIPPKRTTVRDTLIVTLIKNKIYPKTTYSFKNCSDNNINNIISSFVTKNGKSLVSKYYFNGYEKRAY